MLFLSAGPATAGPAVISTTLGEVVSTRSGVVVIASAAAPAEAVWPIAKAIYADTVLRPKLSDAEARALAGEPSDSHKELFELRAKVTADDAPSRAILAEIARRTGARAIAVVFVVDGQPEVRVWDAADERFAATRHRREASGWEPLASGLHTKVAAKKPIEPGPAPASSFTRSPWFWGALGAAVVAGVAVWALTSDDGGARPVVVQW